MGPSRASELIDLLNILGLLEDLEGDQTEQLTAILDGPLITVDDVTSAAVLPVADDVRKPPKPKPAKSGAKAMF
jgi:hypothetical protein